MKHVGSCLNAFQKTEYQNPPKQQTTNKMKKSIYKIALTLSIFLTISGMINISAQSRNAVAGDANGDREVNIADVNTVINIILGGTPTPTADVNNDDEINIADINFIINIILNPGQETPGIVNPENVFTNGLPKAIDGMVINTNDKGQVVSIVNEETIVTFYYNGSQSLPSNVMPTRASSDYDVIMEIKEDEYETIIYYLTLNSDGFVTHAVETYSEYGSEFDEGDILDFEYNSDGHLTKMIQDYDYDDETVIEWQDGDITRVNFIDGESSSENFTATVYYTNSTHTTKVENKGCVMFYDETFCVDIDHLVYAYYAGMLGKATKHLPMSLIQNYPEYGDSDTYEFNWEFNSDGFPIKVYFNPYDYYTIEW